VFRQFLTADYYGNYRSVLLTDISQCEQVLVACVASQGFGDYILRAMKATSKLREVPK
jgi:hypothetical protein